MKDVVITGIGIISAHGLGKERLRNLLRLGNNLLPAPEVGGGSRAGREAGCLTIRELDEGEFLDPKTIKYLQRAEKLTLISSQLALADAGIVPAQLDELRAGVAVGSVAGNLTALESFEEQVLSGDADYLDPALVPSGLLCSLSGTVSIKNGLRGFHAPIAAGEASGLQAIIFALLALSTGRADAALAGGVEEVPRGHHRASSLAAQGVAPLTEAAAVLFLESADSAIRRKAAAYAECAGFGLAYATAGGDEAASMVAAARAMEGACADAGVRPEEIDLIYVSSSGGHKDPTEVRAIERVFARRSPPPPVCCLKSLFGESLGASGAVQTAAAALSIQDSLATAEGASWGRAGRAREKHGRRVERVLVNSFSSAGHKCSLVLRKV